MRLISPRQMAEALQKKEIKRGEFIIYLIFLLLIEVFSVLALITTQYASELIFYSAVILHIFTVIFWISFAYLANRIGDDKNLWYRFVCINIPLTVIFFFIAFIIAFITVFAEKPGEVSDLVFGWADFFWTAIVSILYIGFVYRYIRLISEGMFKERKPEELREESEAASEGEQAETNQPKAKEKVVEAEAPEVEGGETEEVSEKPKTEAQEETKA